jgi:hypothetical protein
MLIFDRLKLSSERVYTDEGFLTTPARIARSGIQEYSAEAMGLPDADPNKIVKVYRPPEEVFSADSMKTFAFKPVTNEHPPVLLDATNARQFQIGLSGAEVVKDGDFVKTTITITDGDTIDSIRNGKVELSNGYIADIVWGSGVTEDGIEYDAKQTNIRGNHIAVVQRGRAGPEVKVADSKPIGEQTMLITIDGVEYEVSAQVAQAVGKLQSSLQTAETENFDATTKINDAVAAADAAKAEADAAKAKLPTIDQLDAMVAERSELVSKCRALFPELKWQGKDNATLKREVVAARCPEVVLDSVSADYINARFDILAESTNTELTDALSTVVTKDDKEDVDCRPAHVIAREKMISDSRNAWKKGDAK